MKIIGRYQVCEVVEINILDALLEIREEFINSPRRGSSGMIKFDYYVAEENRKYFLMEIRDCVANEKEHRKYREISKEDYEYFLSLNAVIQYHINIKRNTYEKS